VACRYCQVVIQVERKKPPVPVLPIGTPGAVPSRTLYLDPAAERAVMVTAKSVGYTIVGVLISLVVVVGPWAFRTIKGIVKPFPVACGLNEEIAVSGNYEGTGPKVSFKSGVLKGNPALQRQRQPSLLELDGTRGEGAQKVPAR
jgi:hypothetical protein